MVCIEGKLGLYVVSVLSFDIFIEFVPFLVHGLSIIFVLLHCVLFLGCWAHFDGFFKRQWIDFFQDGLKSDERLL